nr:hypothetical protein [uncultured Acidocella sp.]
MEPETSDELEFCLKSPRELKTLEFEWLELFSKKRSENSDNTKVAISAPFFSTPYGSYRPGQNGTVLLIGKATSGTNTRQNREVEDLYSVEDIKLRTQEVMAEQIGKPGRGDSSAFLRFALKLSYVYNESSLPFENLIWSNVDKIGLQKGNPRATNSGIPDALIAETIASEIKAYQPRLVFFATGWHRYGLVRKIILGLTGEDIKTGENERFWLSQKAAIAPDFIWTMHPQKKNLETTNRWLNIARDALRQSSR